MSASEIAFILLLALAAAMGFLTVIGKEAERRERIVYLLHLAEKKEREHQAELLETKARQDEG
jgi:hypothetical protein